MELARSALTLAVPPDRSILDVAEDAGVGVLSSCTEGTCGTCETAVLGGLPDHRDFGPDRGGAPGRRLHDDLRLAILYRAPGAGPVGRRTGAGQLAGNPAEAALKFPDVTFGPGYMTFASTSAQRRRVPAVVTLV